MNCRINVQDFGAKGDGRTDDTLAFQLALRQRKSICIPAGVYKISQTLQLNSGVSVQGANTGSTVIEVPNDRSFTVFEIAQAANVHVSNLSITKKAGHPNPENLVLLTGISIRNGSQDIQVEKVNVDGCFVGFETAVDEVSATPIPGKTLVHPRNQRIVFRDCRATHSVTPNEYTSQFGFKLDDCNVVKLEDCHADNHWLDGVKVRKFTSNVIISDGSFCNNGVSGRGRSGAGDGLDAYAGGEALIIRGSLFADNTGNGITVKTGELNNPTEGSFFGQVTNIQIQGVKCTNNTANGLYITRNVRREESPAQIPLLSGIVVQQGLFQQNTWHGIYIKARNVQVTAPIVHTNGQHGINVAPGSIDVAIVSPIIVKNGTESAGRYSGIYLSGIRVKVSGGVINGKDDLFLEDEQGFDHLPAFHNFGIAISEATNNVFIDYVNIVHHTNALDIESRVVAGPCIINRYGKGSPEGRVCAGPGSFYQRTDAVDGDLFYLKQQGYDCSGWVTCNVSD